jgi:hypothetical protein
VPLEQEEADLLLAGGEFDPPVAEVAASTGALPGQIREHGRDAQLQRLLGLGKGVEGIDEVLVEVEGFTGAHSRSQISLQSQ